MLERLLEQTKLGAERREVLHWLSASKDIKKRRLLTFRTIMEAAPNAGLTNQILCLVGAAIFANATESALLLPNFSAWSADGQRLWRPMPFQDLFDLNFFVRRSSTVLTAGVFDLSASNATKGLFHRLELNGDRGWYVYKAAGTAFGPSGANRTVQRDRHRALRRAHAIEMVVLSALRPSSRVRRRALFLIHRLLGDGAPYGCIHTRVERDMLRAVHFNKAGDVPELPSYLSRTWAQRFPSEILAARRVFVPVGLDLRGSDERRLRGQTEWNVSLVRTMGLTRGKSACSPSKGVQEVEAKQSRAPGGHSSRVAVQKDAPSPPWCESPNHLTAALVDMTICRGARWFMGWSGSTYARLLGLYQGLDHGRGFFVACPGVACRVERAGGLGWSEREGRGEAPLLPHSFCQELMAIVRPGIQPKASYSVPAPPAGGRAQKDARAGVALDSERGEFLRWFLRSNSANCAL
jgi:hypothetical protein